MSPHANWYQAKELFKSEPALTAVFSSGKKDKPPVTVNDKRWLERKLILLAQLLKPDYFNSLATIAPASKYFERDFSGAEEDANFILDNLIQIMEIKGWDGNLKFHSNQPIQLSYGIASVPAEGLSNIWNNPPGSYVESESGVREIWIEAGMLESKEGLIAAIARQLGHHKLIVEEGIYNINNKNELLADLMCIVFGLGIFLGNSYFMCSQWDAAGYSGWKMRRTGCLPEQTIAYAMAWLAHYRDEDISWTHYLNKTMRKYFDQSYKYIAQNKDSVKWG